MKHHVRTQEEVNAEFQAGVDAVVAKREARKRKPNKKKAKRKSSGGLGGTGNYLLNPKKFRENQEKYPTNK